MSWLVMSGIDMPWCFGEQIPELLLDMANAPMPKGVGPSTTVHDLICPSHLPMPNELPPYPQMPEGFNSKGSYGLSCHDLDRLPFLKEQMARLGVWLEAPNLHTTDFEPVIGSSQQAYMKVRMASGAWRKMPVALTHSSTPLLSCPSSLGGDPIPWLLQERQASA